MCDRGSYHAEQNPLLPEDIPDHHSKLERLLLKHGLSSKNMLHQS